MFVTDSPIRSKAEDQLKRASFAETLGAAILEYEEKDSLAIGLYGNWGSGKTSVINMACEAIENGRGDDTPIVLRFNPWNYSDQNQLIAQFFKELARVLPIKDEGFKKAARLLDVYGAAITPFVYIPNPQTPLAVIQKKGCQWLADLLRKFVKDRNLDELKTELNTLLGKSRKKILVVIDDIDRLNNTEIRQIFQLIKSLADFKNTIYLLAFDRNVVVKALAKVQEGDGDEYLGKVVQVPFEVPAVLESEVHRFLFASLDAIMGDVAQERWDQRYWQQIFFSGIRVFFRTIRDVNRFTNIFTLKYHLLADDVNLIDLTAATAIQVFLPNLHTAVSESRDMFVEGCEDRDYRQNRREALASAFDEILERCVQDYPKDAVAALLKQLFPRIQSFCGGATYGGDFDSQWRRSGRICSDDVFDIYFRFNMPSGRMSKSEIEKIIATASDYNRFRCELENLQSDAQRLADFLERMLDYSEEIPLGNVQTIVSVLIAIGDSFPEGGEGWFSFDNTTHIRRINYWLLKRIKDQDRCYEITRGAIADATNSLYTIVDAVIWLGWEHGKWTDKGPNPKEDQKVSESQLAELEKLACEKISQWAHDGRLVKHKRLIGILWQWERWAGEETVRRFVDDTLATDDGLVNFIDKTPSVVRSRGMADYGYTTKREVNLQSLSHFVELTEIVPRLKSIGAGDIFQNLEDQQKEAIELVIDTYDGKRKSSFPAADVPAEGAAES